jgi:mannosyltransferase OCH1-like enzyme
MAIENKNIHIIWLQGWDKLPEKFQANVQSVIDKNPDWNVLKWSEKGIQDILKNIGPEYLKKYNELPYLHQKVDMGRYGILYSLGGGSVDVDVVALRGFDNTPDLSTSDFIVSYNSSNAFENYIKNGKSVSLNNATILVSKNNPIMKGLLDHILELSCDITESKESCIQGTTGPKEFTNYLNQYKDQITILPNVYFEPCGGNDPYCEIPKVAILDHQHEGSWVRDSHKQVSRAWYWTKQHWIFILIIIIIIILLFSSKSKTT